MSKIPPNAKPIENKQDIEISKLILKIEKLIDRVTVLEHEVKELKIRNDDLEGRVRSLEPDYTTALYEKDW